MTKRSIPFVDYMPIQRKIHIGSKEVDLGVAKETRMQVVYEKTKALLYNGGRTQQSDCINTETTKPPTTSLKSQSKQQHFRQLCLDATCQLKMNAEMPNSQRFSTSHLINVKCISCSHILPSHCNNCFFCEKPICAECIRRCAYCFEDFCPLCSCKLYNQREDSAVCLSCSVS